MAYRMLTPIPSGDLKVIDLFLRNHKQALGEVRRIWIGGPSKWGGIVIYEQTGRPYRVTTQSSDGSRWTHDLAVGGKDALGKSKLLERRNGASSPVIL